MERVGYPHTDSSQISGSFEEVKPGLMTLSEEAQRLAEAQLVNESLSCYEQRKIQPQPLCPPCWGARIKLNIA